MKDIEQRIQSELDKAHKASMGLSDSDHDREVCSRLDALAIELMESRPDLEQASLDEWMVINDPELTDTERKAASAIIEAYFS